jgi:hypothetical protein
MVTLSGLLFDGTKDDPTFSSSDIIESFVDKYESIHKLNLPMPNHAGIDYRRIFLKNTGFDTDDNYALLTYSRCISFNPDVGVSSALTNIEVNTLYLLIKGKLERKNY